MKSPWKFLKLVCIFYFFDVFLKFEFCQSARKWPEITFIFIFEHPRSSIIKLKFILKKHPRPKVFLHFAPPPPKKKTWIRHCFQSLQKIYNTSFCTNMNMHFFTKRLRWANNLGPGPRTDTSTTREFFDEKNDFYKFSHLGQGPGEQIFLKMTLLYSISGPG